MLTLHVQDHLMKWLSTYAVYFEPRDLYTPGKDVDIPGRVPDYLDL